MSFLVYTVGEVTVCGLTSPDAHANKAFRHTCRRCSFMEEFFFFNLLTFFLVCVAFVSVVKFAPLLIRGRRGADDSYRNKLIGCGRVCRSGGRRQSWRLQSQLCRSTCKVKVVVIVFHLGPIG